MTTSKRKSVRLKKIEAMLVRLVQLRTRIFVNNTSCGDKQLSGPAETKLHDQYAKLSIEYGEIVTNEIIAKLPLEIQNIKKKNTTAEFKTAYRDFNFGDPKIRLFSLGLLVMQFVGKIANPTHDEIISLVLISIKQSSLIIEIPGTTFTEINSEGK